MSNNGALYTKIAKVSSLLAGKLQPDKENLQQRYRYISADLVLQEAGKAMASEPIVVVPTITAEATEHVTYTDNYGKQKSRYDSVVEFDMVVADGDGNTITQHWLGRGSDYSVPDKAYYKAITSGHKYFLMKLFNIGAGNEDGEHEELPEKKESEPSNNAKKPNMPQKPTQAMINKFHALGTEKYGDAWDDKRPELVAHVTKGRVTSSNYLERDEMARLIDGMERIPVHE